MDKTDLLFLLDYSAWANQKLSKAAAQLSPGQFTASCPANYGNLRRIFVHMLVAHQVWLSRCRDGCTPTAFPADDVFPDFVSFEKYLRIEEAAWRDYLDALSDKDVQRSVVYTTSRGETFSTPLWQIVAHLVNHTTQHRSEAAEVLTQQGYSPGDLDLIRYLQRQS